jgi:hypothetical protein
LQLIGYKSAIDISRNKNGRRRTEAEQENSHPRSGTVKSYHKILIDFLKLCVHPSHVSYDKKYFYCVQLSHVSLQFRQIKKNMKDRERKFRAIFNRSHIY